MGVVDRYGRVERWFSAGDCDQFPSESRVAVLLQGAETICPERGVPEERWLQAAG